MKEPVQMLQEADHGEKADILHDPLRQASLLDKVQDAICLMDLSQRILYWNKGAQRRYGWSAHQALGRNADELFSHDDPAGASEALRSLIRHGDWQGVLYHVTKDNRKIAVQSRWTLLRDEAGAPQTILVISTDITEQRQLEAALQREQQVSGVGALLGGLAHDLNNALTPAVMGTALLRNEPLSPQALQMIDLMAKSIQRGAEMVKQILTFARGVSGQHVLIDVRELVAEVVRLVQRTFPGTIQVRSNVATDICPVTGNPVQLRQALMSLCENARDAMPDGGELNLEAANATVEAAGRRSGSYVQLKVSDTGRGIAPQQRQKLFEPFFSTKPPGQRTGLGLPTTIGILKAHGGFLDVSSEVGKGSAFMVYLPAKAQE